MLIKVSSTKYIWITFTFFDDFLSSKYLLSAYAYYQAAFQTQE